MKFNQCQVNLKQIIFVEGIHRKKKNERRGKNVSIYLCKIGLKKIQKENKNRLISQRNHFYVSLLANNKMKKRALMVYA